MELLMNDKNYVKSGRARKLPIYDCLINENWEETGLAHIFVVREHVNGNLTVGAFLIDILCVGLKDTFYRFNIAPWEFDEIIEVLDGITGKMVTCDYNQAHNIVYGGIEFANEFGIPPAKKFEITRMTKMCRL